MEPRVTIVVVPRERFSLSAQSLESLYACTDRPFKLVYVDGNSPAAVRDQLRAAASRWGFDLVRTEHYLSPNAARTLGFERVETEFVVFVDNDLFVTPGWLDQLVSCADETGAWGVGPLYMEGDPTDDIIHMAGGDCELAGEAGHRRFSTVHRLQGTRLSALDAPLRREVVDFFEFHCALVRSDVLRELGGLDEQLRSSREHLDLSLRINEAGGKVWFEPSSRVTYVTPPPLATRDIPFFMLRWSEDWITTSLDHFCAKYGIDPSYKDRIASMRRRRHIVFAPVRSVATRAVGKRAAGVLVSALTRGERAINARFVRASGSASPR